MNPVINSGVKRGFVSNEFDESSGPQAERRACGPSFLLMCVVLDQHTC